MNEEYISWVPRSKDVRWYQKTLGDKLTPQSRDLLVNYSNVSEEDIEKHIYDAREYAWSLFPFPCIGGFSFLAFGLSKHARYNDLLTRMKSSDDKLLDIGTCFGQDLRKLAYDGVNPANLCGTDLIAGYEEAGFKLFNDRDRFANHFFASDILSEDKESPLVKGEGKWNVLTAFLFLHVFDLPDCKIACTRMLHLTAGPGSWIMGVLSASTQPGEGETGPPFAKEGETRKYYRHSRETFVEMWEDVAKNVGKKIDIWAEYDDRGLANPTSSFFTDSKRLWFFIKTLE